MPKIVIGVMGPGAQALEADLQQAYQLGYLIASEGWILLTGGRNVGVMDAASRGAKQAEGLTIGVLPSVGTKNLSEAVDIPIFTGMGSARNNINVLSSQVVIACGMGAGTASEIALAIKAGKPVILLNAPESARSFFRELASAQISIANQPEEAIAIARRLLTHSDYFNIEKGDK